MDIMQDYRAYFRINPEIRFGKPCVINTRITVSDILMWLASGMTFNEIIEDYPELKRDDILAALSYAAHREQSIKTLIYDKAAS
jgi:uncharacterized protein (DUF433 family)